MQLTDTDDLGVTASRYQPLCHLVSQKRKELAFALKTAMPYGSKVPI